MENDSERWLGPAEGVIDIAGVVVGYVRPYAPSKYSDIAHWAWRSTLDATWQVSVKTPTRKIRHKEMAQALVIASCYGGY